VALGFKVEYLGLTPDGSGDLMRVNYTQTWAAESASLKFGMTTGFDYFDSGVVGGLGGSISAAIQPVTLNITMGVDVIGGLPTFYVSEDSSLTVGGISVAGSVSTNMAIRNLLDVDVTGPVAGSLSGSLTFSDADADSKLRVSQLSGGTSVVRTSLNGSISFTPTLTAHLPIIGRSVGAVTGGDAYQWCRPRGNPDSHSPLDGIREAAAPNSLSQHRRGVDLFGGSEARPRIDLSTNLHAVGKGLERFWDCPRFSRAWARCARIRDSGHAGVRAGTDQRESRRSDTLRDGWR